jgi:2-dehydropantoate 2-reductase
MRSSMMMDVVAGRRTEVEALLGAVVRRGRARGVPTPVVETLYGVLKPVSGSRG